MRNFIIVCILSVFPHVYAQSTLRPNGIHYEEFNIQYKDLKARLYKDGNYYGGDIKMNHLVMDGGVGIARSHGQFLVTHAQGIEVYNWTLNEWVEAKIIPTDVVLVTKDGITAGHIPGMEILNKKKKTGFYFGVGPSFNIQEFNQDFSLGAVFKFRIKFGT